MTETVYLAGPITGLSFADAIGWREEATEELTALGYEVFSPMREKFHLKEEFGDAPLPHTHHSFADPFPRDVLDIRRSDFVLCNLLQWDGTTPLVGTSVELGLARAMGKFVVTVRKPGFALHPFLAGCSDLVMDTLERAYEWLEHMKPVQAGRVVMFKLDDVPEIDLLGEGDPFGGVKPIRVRM